MSVATIQVSSRLAERLEQCAREKGSTSAQVLEEAIQAYLLTHGKNGRPGTRRRLAEIADNIAADVPETEWAQVPSDLAKNFEHYRHGYPRED